MGVLRYVTALTAAFVGLALFPAIVVAVLYAALRPTSRPDVDRDREWLPRVSVVVPTYNEANLVVDRLDSLLDTAYPTEKLEVVLADDSTDDTAERARAFFERRQPDASLRVVSGESRHGVATALNRAIPAASGEVVFRTDADARVAPEAIPEAVATLADPAVGAVTGRQTTVVGESVVESDYRSLLARLQALETRLDSTFIAHGPCFAFRREQFETLPPDTIADDTATAISIRTQGLRVVMDPAVTFTEGGVSSLRRRRNRKDRRAAGLLQQLFRHRSMLGRYHWYGRLVLPLNWGLMVVAPWALAAVLGLATLTTVAVAGPLGLAVPGLVGAVLLLGSRERLGPLQPLHAVADAYVSLLVASVRLARGNGDAVWTVDTAGREGFD